MFRSLVISSSSIVLAACAATVTETVAEPVAVASIEQVWVSEGFESPEGAAEAPNGGYFISNVVGEGRDKDGNGYIAHIGPDGSIIEQQNICLKFHG